MSLPIPSLRKNSIIKVLINFNIINNNKNSCRRNNLKIPNIIIHNNNKICASTTIPCSAQIWLPKIPNILNLKMISVIYISTKRLSFPIKKKANRMKNKALWCSLVIIKISTMTSKKVYKIMMMNTSINRKS